MRVMEVADNLVVPAGPGSSAAMCLALADNPAGGSHPGIAAWLGDSDGPQSCIAWSGTLADGLFDREAMTWLSAGTSALETFCDEFSPRLESTDRRLLFRPHCRHVLSDAMSCVRFIESQGDQPFGLALCPASLLEHDMLGAADDHLRRIFEMAGPISEVVMLSDVTPPADDAGPDGCPRLAPIGEGVLDIALVRSLLREHCRPETPIVFPLGASGSQASRLGLN